MSKDRKIRNLKSNSASLLESEFTKIYKENFDRLYFFAFTYAKSEELAKDIVSEVFLNLWKNRTKFSEIRQLESYLYIAIKNQAIHVLSRNLKHTDSIEFEKEAKMIDKVDPEELLLEKELLREIELAVEELPDQCQLVFNMAKNQQMRYKEIAEELGISVSTVRMQLIKASGIIRETIRKKYSDEQGTDVLRIGAVRLFLLALIG